MIYRWHLRFRSLKYLKYVRRYAVEYMEPVLHREANRLIEIIEKKEKIKWRNL